VIVINDFDESDVIDNNGFPVGQLHGGQWKRRG
jgi:hypothetical protein